jgi:hypothetical protein
MIKRIVKQLKIVRVVRGIRSDRLQKFCILSTAGERLVACEFT